MRRYMVAVGLTAVLALSSLTLASGGAGSQSLGFDAISVDMDPSGNTATALGARQECREALPGAMIDIDVTVENISPQSPLFAYSYDLDFAGPSIIVVGQQLFKIESNSGSQPTNVSDPLPASMNRWTASVLDLGNEGEAHESGNGTLDRLTVEVSTDVAPAIYTFSLSSVALVDLSAVAHSPRVTRNGRLAIGVSCSGSTPLPEITASATPISTGSTDPTGATDQPTTSTQSPTTAGPSPGSETPTPRTPSGSASVSPGPYDQPSPSDTPGDDGGSTSTLWIGLAIAILVMVAAAGGWWAYRRLAAS